MHALRLLHIEDSALRRRRFRSWIGNADSVRIVGQIPAGTEVPQKIINDPPDIVAISTSSLRKYPDNDCTLSVSQEQLSKDWKKVFGRDVDIVFCDDGMSKEDLHDKVLLSSKTQLTNRSGNIAISHDTNRRPSALLPIVAIGASTGGVDALTNVLPNFSKDCAPILIVQHMKPSFISGFASRLNSLCEAHVSIALDGAQLERGNICVAPGGSHLEVRKNGRDYYCRLTKNDQSSNHTPSVDVLFSSISKLDNPRIAVLLTGMGRDGADGMLEVRNSGGTTIAQDEASSIVYGMPKSAVKIGAVEFLMPLQGIGGKIIERLDAMTRRGSNYG